MDWAIAFSGRPLVAAASQGVFCPYCRGALQDSVVSRCLTCGTLHHESCFGQHGGCAIFGCRQT